MHQVIIALPVLSTALLRTIELSVATFVIAFLIGTLIAELSAFNNRLLNVVIRTYVDIVRGVPLLVFIFLIYYSLPLLGWRLDNFAAAVVALSAYFSGFVTEIVRAARGAIPSGQVQSALALGMTRYKAEWVIVAPQALRIALPGLVNLCAIAIKSTSLVSIIGVWELTTATREIVMRTIMPFTFFLLLMAIYFVLCFSLSRLSKSIERRLALAYS